MSRLEGDLAATAGLLKARTLDYAQGLVTGEQLVDLADLADDAAEALAGDERAKAHLEAQFALQTFSGTARVWLESAKARRAFAAALVDIAQEAAVEGAKFVARALAESLAGSVDL